MSYPSQYPYYQYFASEFDQPSSLFGYEGGASFEPHQYDQWTPTQSNSWEPNSHFNQSYQSWEPNSNHVVSNEFGQGDSFLFQSFTPYTYDYWDPNQTTSDFMGPNQFNPPLDSQQEQWAYNQNFNSDSPLPNQISEWRTHSFDP